MLASQASSNRADAKGVACLRVLIADDCRVCRYVTRDVLYQLGIQATLASNGAEAVDLAFEQHFDVILMDIEMPVMDGIVATARIRERESTDPARPRVRVVAYTARELSKAEPELLRIGMDAVLEKPCGFLSMSACLSHVCGEKFFQHPLRG